MKTTACWLLLLAAWSAHASPDEIMNKAGCMACHAKDKKMMGPSFKDIAAKYKGQGDAPVKLAEKVRKGGMGSFGPVAMAPIGPSKISDADLKVSIEAILKY